jgi:hypothetical protein
MSIRQRPLLLALPHGLKVLQELSLRYRAQEGIGQRDVGHFAVGDEGDGDFDTQLLALPVAGWAYGLSLGPSPSNLRRSRPLRMGCFLMFFRSFLEFLPAHD